MTWIPKLAISRDKANANAVVPARIDVGTAKPSSGRRERAEVTKTKQPFLRAFISGRSNCVSCTGNTSTDSNVFRRVFQVDLTDGSAGDGIDVIRHNSINMYATGLQFIDQRAWIDAFQALGSRVLVGETFSYRLLAKRGVMANNPHVLLNKGAYRARSDVLGNVRDKHSAHECFPCGLT